MSKNIFLKSFVALIGCLSLGQCAYMSSYRSESAQYSKLIDKEVKEARLFVRGEQRMAIKVLAASERLFQLQNQEAPGFAFKYSPEKHQVILAVSSQNRIPFMRDEMKFWLDEDLAEGVEELTSSFQIQTLYPYAYPYYRVLVIDFIGSQKTEREFKISTSRGPLSVKLQFFPSDQNRIN